MCLCLCVSDGQRNMSNVDVCRLNSALTKTGSKYTKSCWTFFLIISQAGLLIWKVAVYMNRTQKWKSRTGSWKFKVWLGVGVKNGKIYLENLTINNMSVLLHIFRLQTKRYVFRVTDTQVKSDSVYALLNVTVRLSRGRNGFCSIRLRVRTFEYF